MLVSGECTPWASKTMKNEGFGHLNKQESPFPRVVSKFGLGQPDRLNQQSQFLKDLHLTRLAKKKKREKKRVDAGQHGCWTKI